MDQFNAIRTQIDEMAKDSGYKGVNLLDGEDVTLTVTFNEGRTNKLDIKGVDASVGGDTGATGLKIAKAAWGGTALVTVATTGSGDAAKVEGAVAKGKALTSQRI